MPSAPNPSHIVRLHSSSINCVTFSKDNLRLCAGDADGFITITSTLTLRPLANWKAHSDSVLGVEEWNDCVLSHGRDHKLHVWDNIESLGIVSETATQQPLVPTLRRTVDVNSLNYCRFSLFNVDNYEKASEPEALLALPNLSESSLADIWTVPSFERLHSAIGIHEPDAPISLDVRGDAKTGIIMALHVYRCKEGRDDSNLRLLAAYESGELVLWQYNKHFKQLSTHSKDWHALWTLKCHKEAVMAMAVSPDNSFALSVSSEHIIGKYSLEEINKEQSEQEPTIYRTKTLGNGSLAINTDGRVCAVGGWDGKIRLYSTKTCKPLGTLTYHKDICRALAFANQYITYNEDPDDLDLADKKDIEQWLVGGGKDGRLSIWKLMDFRKE